MPTYLYECRKCNKTFEVDQRITEDPIKDCSCGAKGAVRRLIQPTAVMFKGSGFHINDYAPKASSDQGAAPNQADSKSETSPSPSTTPATTSTPEVSTSSESKISK